MINLQKAVHFCIPDSIRQPLAVPLADATTAAHAAAASPDVQGWMICCPRALLLQTEAVLHSRETTARHSMNSYTILHAKNFPLPHSKTSFSAASAREFARRMRRRAQRGCNLQAWKRSRDDGRANQWRAPEMVTQHILGPPMSDLSTCGLPHRNLATNMFTEIHLLHRCTSIHYWRSPFCICYCIAHWETSRTRYPMAGERESRHVKNCQNVKWLIMWLNIVKAISANSQIYAI